MPSHRQRASTASAETRSLFPEIPHRSDTNPTSYLIPYTTPLAQLQPAYHQRFHSAVIDGDPFDIAVDWQNYSFRQQTSPATSEDSTATHHDGHHHFLGHRRSRGTAGQRAPPMHSQPISHAAPTDRILVLNTASERRPGGEWEGGVLGAEESLARRSNLVQTLTTQASYHSNASYYPLPETGGIYSPNVVVFRSGHERDYAMWPDNEWTALSVISVAAIARPKVDETGTRYSFSEERHWQKEKMRTILRVAAGYGHINLVLGGFGSCGPGTGDGHGGSSGHNAIGHSASTYRNPVKDVCKMWKELLEDDPEFTGYFKNVVFAVGGGEGGGAREFRRYFG